MILFLVLILLCCLFRIKWSDDCYFDDFLDRKQTDAIKGVFILFVFMRHILQYIKKSGFEFVSFDDKFFGLVDAVAGQLIVVMFLFYSGYGVMESIRNKGKPYISSIPKHRILPTLINFDVAVLFFIAVAAFFGKILTVKQVALSMLCWESVGNSNWYIFDIILCYFITFVTFRFAKTDKRSIALGGGLVVISIIVLALASKPTCWYNTLLAYFAGMTFSVYKEKVVTVWKEKYWIIWFVSGSIFVGIHALTYSIMPGSPIWIAVYNVDAVVFALFVVQTTMKLKVSNAILIWFGVNLFPLYIYQRLPMIVFYEMDEGMFVRNNVPVYVLISFVISCVIAYLYRFWRYPFASLVFFKKKERNKI